MPPKPLRAARVVEAPSSGALKLAVVADTHSHPHPALEAQRGQET